MNDNIMGKVIFLERGLSQFKNFLESLNALVLNWNEFWIF